MHSGLLQPGSTVAVTGATGFIGNALCQVLLDRGVTVRALVRNPRRAAQLGENGVHLVPGDLADNSALQQLLDGADAVVHCAGAVRGNSQADFDEVNVVGTAALLQALLKNTYRAFDFRSEEDVYDKLALSVNGDLLTDIYLQHRRSMAVQQAGGAQAKIKEVAVENASAERITGDDLSYALHGRWTALGTVGHWGHLHQRKNRYEAVIKVTAEEGHWKIIGLDLRDEQRIDKAAPGGTPAQAAAAANAGTGPGS